MKQLFFLCYLVLISMYSYGQARVELGLKGGLNVTNLSSDADATYSSRSGFHAGAYGLVKVANIGIQPELLYSQQGTEVDYAQFTNSLEQDFTYLNIPVMLKFYLLGGLNLQAGPQFGLLLSVDGTTYDEDNPSQPQQLSRDSFEKSDVSAALGAGWDAPFGLNFTIRYVLGLSDISQRNMEAKNRTFQISAGFKLFRAGR